MPKKKPTAAAVMEEVDDDPPEPEEVAEIEAEEEEAPAPKPRQKRTRAKPQPRRLAEDEEEDEDPEDLILEDAPKAPADIGAIEEELKKGATKGLILPRAAAEAQDWGEKIGRALVAAMAASPNGIAVKIVSCERMAHGSYYTVRLKAAGQPVRRGTLELREFQHLCNHNVRELGKWLRRFGNILAGRKATE